MKYTKKMLAMLLALVMTIGVMAPAFAAEAPAEAPSILDEITLPEAEEAPYADDEYVSVIVELASAAVLEVEEFADAYAGNSVGFSMSSTAAEYRMQLTNEQDDIQAEIAEVAEGALFRYSYTNLINGFNAYVQYGDIEAIKAIDGVSSVYVTEQYDMSDIWDEEASAQEFVSLEEYYALTGQVGVDLGVSEASAQADTGSMNELGLYGAWDNGFTGAGKVAAIFDSGLYSDNQLFQYYDLEALQAAYPELNLDTDVNGGTVRTEEGIKQILNANKDTMNIFQSSWNDWFHAWDPQYPVNLPSGFGDDVAAKIENGDYYTNEKVPFNVDYANGDFNTWVESETIGTTPAFTGVSSHGTHVAGITAGNAGPEKESLGVLGSAYDAQIFFFKVFKEQDGGGQEGDEDVFAALDDAVTLGVNVFNLSLGIPNGFTTYNNVAQAGYQRAYNSARNAGIAIAISAGNDTREERPGAVFGTGYTAVIPNNASVGASTAMFSPFTIASAQGLGYVAWNSSNAPQTTATFVSGEETVLSLTLADRNGPLSLGEELTEAVELVWAGTKEEVAAAADNAYEGKVAVVELTSARQYTVVTDVLNKGAVAAVVVNYSNSNSALSVSYLQVGTAFGAISTANGELLEAAMAEGTVTVTFTTEENDVPASNNARTYADNGPVNSTSWGVTEALRLTPDIMAPGGNILSAGVSQPNSMATMSGTSMASPNLAGCYLLAQQYVDTLIADGGLMDNKVEAGTLEYATLVDNIIASTALPYMPYESSSTAGPLMRDGEEGRADAYYSPRRQGSGMAQMDKATQTKAYLTSTMEVGYNLVTGESQRSKIELGELGMAQEFTMQYVVVNMDTVAHTFQVETAIQTDATELAANGRYNIVTRNNYGTDVDTIDGAVITVESIEGGNLVASSSNTNRFNDLSAPASVQVPAGASATVTLKVVLPDMAAYDAIFVNGMFLEGYVFMYDTTRRAVTTDLSMPWIGFRGDWNDASIFDFATAYEDVSDKALSDVDYPVYHIDNLHTKNTINGVTTDAVLGANQYTGAAVPQFNSSSSSYTSAPVARMRTYLDTLRTNGNLNGDWSSFSPNGDSLADDIYAQFGLLRNAKMLGVQILDAEGNLVNDLGYEWEYFELLASDGNLSQIVQTTAYDKYDHDLGWDGTDAEGNVVPEGQYYYKMTALIEADYLDLVNEDETRAELNAFIKSLERTESLVNGPELQSIKDKLDELVGEEAKALLDASTHTITMPVKVDTTAPVVTGAYVNGTWTVNVTDEVGVQAVVMYYDGAQVGETVLINATEGTATFDVSALGEIDTNKLDVQAIDFAMNTASMNAEDAKVKVIVNLDGEDVNAADEELAYTLSVENAATLATATFNVELDATYVEEPVVEALNGFTVLDVDFEEVNGKWVGTVVVFNVAGVATNEAVDVVAISAANKGVVGNATASVTGAVLSAYAGEGELYLDWELGNAEATIKVDYVVYDVNRDGVVNQLDLTRAQRNFGSADPVCDVNDDGIVSIDDILLILNNYTK